MDTEIIEQCCAPSTDNYVSRMKHEYVELEEKINKLSTFINENHVFDAATVERDATVSLSARRTNFTCLAILNNYTNSNAIRNGCIFCHFKI